jgi:5,5'-dehydrodivanillate O-demethylase
MTMPDIDFVHTGPGTLAGKYLRSFWQPVFRAADLLPGRAVPIKIMSEDLTLYRGEGGQPHVVSFRCPHRGTQLSIGSVEEDCIRCHYHGWKFDGSGQCVEQPGEDEPYARKVRIQSYPTREYLGLIFAYLSNGDAPDFRRYPDFEREGLLKTGTPEVWPCNYFNRCENGLNSAHVPFTHRESAHRVKRLDRLVVRDVSVEETDYGIRETQNVPGRPTQYVHFHMPNVNQPRSALRIQGSVQDAGTVFTDRLFWYVPIDDTRSVTFVVDYIPLTGERAKEFEERSRQAERDNTVSPNKIAEAILRGEMRVKDIDPNVGTYLLFWVEDYLSMVGQGSIPDRSDERLGRMDVGVILLRKIWQRELTALANQQPLKQWTSPPGLADQTVTEGQTRS